MPLDSEKKRLEARLLQLLGKALSSRNQEDIVGTSLELGALYLSGDLYDKAEESFQRVLDEPISDMAQPREKARAEVGLAEVAGRRGHLTAAREALERADKQGSGFSAELQLLRGHSDLLAGHYREVMDDIEALLSSPQRDKLGDATVDFMVLEARARHLSGRNQRTQRLLEKALELAESNGYESGTAKAHSELGAFLAARGDFKLAQEHLLAALRSDEGMGSQFRLDQDRCRLGQLLFLMGRWDEAADLLRQSYQSSRDLRALENRLCCQLMLARLHCLQGRFDDAHDQALDGMEVARAAGYLLLHVNGLVTLSLVATEADDARTALEYAREAEALYGRRAPESATMLAVYRARARAHAALGQHTEAYEVLTRGHALARETGNTYAQTVIEAQMGRHHLATGDTTKAAEMLQATASALGNMSAKYDVALVRLWYAEVLWKRCLAGISDDRARDIRLARSNAFESRRLLEAMHAQKHLAEVAALEQEWKDDAPSHPPTDRS